jgi:uncharacterized protein (DUF1499 family)
VLDIRRVKLKWTPNQYLLAPAGYGAAKPHCLSPTLALPAARLAEQLKSIIDLEPRIEWGKAQGDLRFDLVQRSRIFRFPDLIAVEAIAQGEHRSTLAIYSRSRYGRRDFGVNRQRVERWLAMLAARLG